MTISIKKLLKILKKKTPDIFLMSNYFFPDFASLNNSQSSTELEIGHAVVCVADQLMLISIQHSQHHYYNRAYTWL